MTRKAKVPASSRIIDLLPDWVRDMRAIPRSPRTITNYTMHVRYFCRHFSPDGNEQHCDVTVTDVSREMLVEYFADIRERWADTTVMVTHISLSAFFRFCLEYEELPEGSPNPMKWIKNHKPAPKLVTVLSDEEIRKLLATCERGKTFDDRRDYAIMRIFLATGLRMAELTALRLEDVRLDEGIVRVARRKGGKEGIVAFGPEVARALGQYIHIRARHKYAHLPDLWLGRLGKLQYATIRDTISRKRAKQAGLVGIHPHLFRHWFAHGYLAAGGQENALLELAGWSDARMLHERYGASRRRERAIAEHHRLGIGEHL